MPTATASSKLVSERTVMVVTLATDDMAFLLEQAGFPRAPSSALGLPPARG
jgi:hypothetical protein